MAKYKIISIPQYAPGGETNGAPEWLKKKKKKKKSGEEEVVQEESVQEEPVVTNESSENTTSVVPIPDVSRYVSETADNGTDVEFPEVNVYAQDASRKLQGNLLEQFRQVKNAFQNARAANVANGDQYNFGLNLEETSDINKLPGLIKRYKDALEQEKIRFAREKNVFDQLKELDPETWDVKNSRGSKKRHQSEAISAEGLNTFRNAMKAGKLSPEDFMYIYNAWGKFKDPNAVQGKGPGAAYSQKDLEEKWDSKGMKDFIKMLEKGMLYGGVGLGAAAGAGPYMALSSWLSGPLAYAPVKALPWLTGGNALNAYFAYETFKPEGYAQTAVEDFSKGNYWSGAGNTLMSALGVAPFVRPAINAARTFNQVTKPGSLSVLPFNSNYSVAYKTPLQSGVVIGNPNIGKATETFTSITSPLNKFTKHAELGEIKIFKQTPRNYRSGSDASYATATQGVLGDAKIVEDAMVQASRTGILGENSIKEQITGVPKSIDTTVPLYRQENPAYKPSPDKFNSEYTNHVYGTVDELKSSGELDKLLKGPNNQIVNYDGVDHVVNLFPQHTAGNWWSSAPVGSPGFKGGVGNEINRGMNSETGALDQIDNVRTLETSIPFSKLQGYSVFKDPMALPFAGHPEAEYILPNEYKEDAKKIWNYKPLNIDQVLKDESISGINEIEPTLSKYNVKGKDAKKQFFQDLQEDLDFQIFKENAKIKDPITGAMQSTFGVPNVQDDFFKGQGLTEEYAVNNDIAGATENLTDDVIKFSKEDNQVASDIINDMRVKKIELWKTAEGQKRLKKMIDNTPSLKGQTPETLIEGITKMENLNNFYAEELKINEDLKKQYEQIEIFHNEGKLSNDEFFNHSVQLDNQIKKSDEFLDKTEGLFKRAGFYSSAANVIGIRPGAFKPEELAKITAHELGHFLGGFGPQKGSTTYLDDMLKDIKLIDDISEQLVIPGLETESSGASSMLGLGTGNYLDRSRNYFLTGSNGTEKVPMVAEVRQALLEEGIIKSEYDKITPKMLRDHYKNYKNRLGEKYPLRIYDIIKDRPENFKAISKVLNYLPMVAGAAGVIEEMSNEDDSRENMEAGLGKFLPLLLLAPLGTKLSKKLRGLAESFSKVGTLALQELKYKDLRYLKKEIKTLSDEWDGLIKHLGYNMNTGLIQEQKRLASIQDQRTRKFQNFLKSRELGPSIPEEEKWMYPLPAQVAVNDKKEIVDFYNQAGIDFRITPEGIEGGGQPNMFEGVTTTGQQTVTDLSTGQPVQAQVILPRNTTEYTLVDGQLIEKNINVENPIISTEYVQSLRNSKVNVESKIPGSIVFGSSLLVTDAGMPHITGDIDILISQSNYNKHVKDKFQFVQDYGPAKQHAVYPDYGKEGVLDFNIVHEDAKGMIIPYYDPMLPDKVPMEIELFRQFYPEKFQEAATRAAVSGKPFEINMSSKEFMAGIDPQVKTIIDSYEISPFNRWGTYNPNKEKHILRPDVLIAYGNPEVVAKGQLAYIKSVVGHKGTLGHQFTKEELSDVGNNVDTLFKMNFTGDYMATANNPERMQLAINDFYINNTVFSRDISMKTMPGGKYTEKNIKKALTEWFPGKGGSVNGIGINFVQKGNPTHVSKWDNPILGHRQLGIKTDTSDPLKYVNSVNRATSGEYVFTEEETKLIEDLVDKYIPDVKNSIPSTGFKSRDILNWDPYEMNNAAKFLDDFTEQTGIRAIRKEETSGTYGVANPAYASVFGKFDELADAMMYSLKDYAVSPKTLNERKRQINAIKQKNASSKTLGWGKEPLDVKTPEDFKKMYSILDGGLATAESRLQNLTDHLSKLNSYKEDLIQKMATGPNDIELQKLDEQIRTSENRIRKISEIKTELEQKQKQAKVFWKILGLGSLGAGLTFGGAELYDMQEKREAENEEILIKRITTFNKLRGVNVTKKVMEGIPDIMSSWLLNNPTATKWPNGEDIEIDDKGKYGDFIRRPIYIKRKPYNPLLHFTEDWEWHYPNDHDTRENQLYKHGGEKSLEMELTPEQIKYYVSKGYIVVAE
jgi:hypothetical protein